MSVSYTTDGYKIGHRSQYYPGTSAVVANWTPRKSRIPGINTVLLFGNQRFMKRYLIKEWNNKFFKKDIDKVVHKYTRRINNYLPPGSEVTTDHLRSLHKLGYLPLVVRAIPEGMATPIRVPQVVMWNTVDEFFWLVNYIETLFSCEMWKPCTSATIAREYYKIFHKCAMETVGNTDFIKWQGHDFSMRGMSGLSDAKQSGAGHLLSFFGTDTIPAIDYLEKWYGADCEKEIIGGSVTATEHAVMCSNTGFFVYNKYNGNWDKIGEAEFDVFERLITVVYPNGIISIVSDTFDLWQVCTDFMVRLKDKIMARDGKVVIRPDSGNPVDILCGHKIIDLTENEDVDDLESAKEWMRDEILEQVREETPHGECGDDTPSASFKYQDKYYKIKLEIDWDRYDKQYYYMDRNRITSCEEYQPTPAEIGVVELLWNVFGGTITEKGYKLLDSHIGTIYGDSITMERAVEICERLKAKGFASINWVAGIGSYTYQYQTRDTFGYAQKSTYCEVEVEMSSTFGANQNETLEIPIFKDPVTDDGTKKSARGLIVVYKDENGNFYLKDNASWSEVESPENQMLEVFRDGKITKEYTLAEIRANVALSK